MYGNPEKERTLYIRVPVNARALYRDAIKNIYTYIQYQTSLFNPLGKKRKKKKSRLEGISKCLMAILISSSARSPSETQ
jgi:hypothetical protein